MSFAEPLYSVWRLGWHRYFTGLPTDKELNARMLKLLFGPTVLDTPVVRAAAAVRRWLRTAHETCARPCMRLGGVTAQADGKGPSEPDWSCNTGRKEVCAHPHNACRRTE